MIKTKYALLIISVCLIAFMFCMGAYDDTSLYWYFPKDVGIYTTSPGAELHVAGTTPEVRIGDDDAEDTSLIFMGNAKDMYIALDDTTDDLTIGQGTTIGSNVVMVIENGGNVGIGTVTPISIVNIYSSTGGWTSASSATLGLQTQSPSLGFQDINSGGIDSTVLYQTGQNFRIAKTTYASDDWGYDAKTDVINIDSGNKVGILTVSPNQELEVAGEALFETTVNADTNDVSLTDSQCRNTFRSNQGASDAQTYTLPSAASGYCITIACVTAQDIHIDPASGDQIIPTTDSAGDRASSDATIGSCITLLAIDNTYWFVTNSIGTWSDID